MTGGISVHIRVRTPSPAKSAAGRWYRREQAAAIETIVRTVCTVFIWTTVRGIGNQTATVGWNLSACGGERAENGLLFTDVPSAGRFVQTEQRRTTIP